MFSLKVFSQRHADVTFVLVKVFVLQRHANVESIFALDLSANVTCTVSLVVYIIFAERDRVRGRTRSRKLHFSRDYYYYY